VAIPPRVTIVEVGPRDGLQNESARIDTADKVAFVDRLSAAGLPVVEVTAFVRADRVPQLADATDVLRAIERRPGVRYSALVPNLKGLEHAAAAKLSEVAVFAAASETFSLKNINRSRADSLEIYADVCREAERQGIRVRGYLSTAFGCPFEGRVETSAVLEMCRALLDLGVFEVSVSDTIGVAHPAQVTRLVEDMLEVVPVAQLALHFHDTRGTALANVLAAIELGVQTFDASVGGLGGCPYAPGATGNLATEDLLYMLDGFGIETGVSMPALLDAARFIEPKVGHALPSRSYRAAVGSELRTKNSELRTQN
jgi:hydroxymethylglutaryl-CoA lyase